jgi:pimeloyl-ACP methyl ester carboxylesterase
MKYLIRSIELLLVVVVVFVIAGIFATWAPDRTVTQLSARWAAPPSQFMEIAGLRIHFRDEGPKDDPQPIVLLHGTADSLHTWDGWVEGLRSQRRVIRFDLPAFGLTGPAPDNNYSIPAYTGWVMQVLDTLGVKHCVLVGNSLGGQIAWETAVAHPERIAKLVLVDAVGYPVASKSVPIGFTLARLPGVKSLMEQILPRGVIQSSVRNVYGDPGKVTSELVDRYYELTLRTGNRAALGQRFAQMVPGNTNGLKKLQIPTLILWGAQDKLIPLDNAHQFARDIAGSKLVVFDDLGHVPQQEEPHRTLDAVRAFLNLV